MRSIVNMTFVIDEGTSMETISLLLDNAGVSKKAITITRRIAATFQQDGLAKDP